MLSRENTVTVEADEINKFTIVFNNNSHEISLICKHCGDMIKFTCYDLADVSTKILEATKHQCNTAYGEKDE